MSVVKNRVQAYWKEEEAAEDIKQILFYILGFALAGAVGYAIWYFVSNTSKGLDTVQHKLDTPDADPFGDGKNPFK